MPVPSAKPPHRVASAYPAHLSCHSLCPEAPEMQASLQKLLDSAPPAPKQEKVGKEATDRPVYPDWPKLK